MYSVEMNNAQELLRFSDVFSSELPELETELAKLNLNKTVSIIAELIAARNYKISVNTMGTEIILPFESSLKGLIGIDLEFKNTDGLNELLFKDKHIISLQCLLILLKYAILYCDGDTIREKEYEISLEDYSQIIRLNLVIAELLDKQFVEDVVDLNHFLYGTYHVNYERNVANALLRSFYMLEIVSRDINNFESDVQCEYRDYYSDFTCKYHYTPTEYLSLLFWELSAYFSNKPALLNQSIWRNFQITYQDMTDAESSSCVIRDLMRPPEFYFEWAKNTKEMHWDFSLFLAYPFIFDGDNGYISISDYTLKNCFFEKLYWMIRECYPRRDDRCMAFYGRLFEKYIQDLTEHACMNNEMISFINEFVVDNNKSSDVYIRNGESLLAIETKGYSILQDTLTKNQSVERNIHKLFVDPVLQADKCFEYFDLKGGYFDGVSEVYIISLTMDSVNAVPEYLEMAYKEIVMNKKSEKVKYVFNLCVEEYEMLMYLIEQKYDIFSLLKNYANKEKIEPFSVYLKQLLNIDFKMTSFMDDLYKQACFEVKKTWNVLK